MKPNTWKNGSTQITAPWFAGATGGHQLAHVGDDVAVVSITAWGGGGAEVSKQRRVLGAGDGAMGSAGLWRSRSIGACRRGPDPSGAAEVAPGGPTRWRRTVYARPASGRHPRAPPLDGAQEHVERHHRARAGVL